MTFSEPKSPLTSARMFDTTTTEALAYWLDNDAKAMDGQPGRNNHVAATRAAVERLSRAFDALAYVDKSIDNVADMPPEMIWENREVIQMLEDIRSMLVTGQIMPAEFIPDHTDGSGA